MFLKTFILLACVVITTGSMDPFYDKTDNKEFFDFGSLEEDLFKRIEQNVEISSYTVDRIVDLPDLHKEEDYGDLEARIKRLQSFHSDLTKSFDDPSTGGPVQGFFKNTVSTGSTLESSVDQLMAKHRVSVEMVEGTPAEDQPVAIDDPMYGGFNFVINTNDVKPTTTEQLLKRVEYLENNFHKDDIARLSDPCAAKPCANNGVCSVVGESYSCQCVGNYFGDNCNQQDNDECRSGMHDCDEVTSTCVNTIGSFICQCNAGFTDNGVQCIANECMRVPDLSGAIIDDTSYTSDAVVATYTCKKDFIFREGQPKATCSTKTGIWELSTMECAPTQCYHHIDDYGVYMGTKHTVMGSAHEVLCQRFDAQSPHRHTWNTVGYLFHENSIADVKNYCRDPDKEGKPWCYTSDPNMRWQYCDIPQCFPGPGCSIAPFVVGSQVTSMKKYPNGELTAEYECKSGFAKVSQSLATCHGDQEWNVDKIICEPTDCYITYHKTLYAGSASRTKSGLTCQRWNSQYPHRHGFTAEHFRGIDELGDLVNYCRDPDNEGVPWCYTTSYFLRWDYCKVPVCTEKGS